MTQYTSVCPYYKRGATRGKKDWRYWCQLTGHACLRSTGEGFSDCGPYLAAQHKDDRLTAKGKAAIEKGGTTSCSSKDSA